MESQINNTVSNPLASCQNCSRQDETIRAVTYPFVISLLFVTFRRTFVGVWCKRHRRRYLFFSSIITACLGWLGIPYGFFYTPLTLFKLAQGGEQDKLLTSQLLNHLGEQKLLANDPMGAIRCFEESLRFRETSELQQKLARLYLQYRPGTQQSTLGALTQFLAVPLLFVMATLTGLGIGIADVIITYLMTPLYSPSDSIIIVIVSWLPLVTILFVGILFIRSRIEWTLRTIRCTHQVLALSLAIFASVFALYSILEGRAIINILPPTLINYTFSIKEALFGIRAVLSYGGILELINFVQAREAFAIIYLVLFATGAALSIYVGVQTAFTTTRWQNHINDIRRSSGLESAPSFFTAWSWLAVIVSTAFLFTIGLYPGRFVNVEQANLHLDNASYAMDNEDMDGTFTELEQAIEIWPDSVRAHSLLGLLYLQQEKYDLAQAEGKTALGIDPESTIGNLVMGMVNMGQSNIEEAIENLKVVSASQPALSTPHAYLAILYYMNDQQELADQEIEQAVQFEDSDNQASPLISTYYLGVKDYGKAEKHILKAVQFPTATPEDYYLLAHVYGIQKKYDKASRALEKAAEMDAKEVDLHIARTDLLLMQGDLPGALAESLAALESSPGNSEAHANLSFVYFQQGQLDEAAREAELAIEANPYNYQAYVEQAFAYHAQGKLAEALTTAQKGAAYSSKSDRAHYILGVAYLDSGMEDEAIREFEEFLELYWDRPLAAPYKENAEKYLEQLK